MSEIKTQPVKAKHITDKEEFRDEYGQGRMPGAFRVTPAEPPDGEQTFWFCCPCGCKSISPLTVGNGFKPKSDDPSWKWNGSFVAPTLEPSVHDKGHWHGWLINGVWKST